MSGLYSAREALKWQKARFGRVIFGIDSLYAIARNKSVPVVWVGTKKMFFPESSLEKLMAGEVAT
jgi:hypothetical protein